MSEPRENRQYGSSWIWVLLLSAVVISAGLGVVLGLGLFDSRGNESAAPPQLSVTVSSQLLEFGVVPVHGSVARKLVLRNDGDAAVDGRVVTDSSSYTVEPTEFTLDPGESTGILVTARPEATGSLDENLTIMIGAATEPLIVSMRGTAQIEVARARTAPPPGSGASAVTRTPASVQRPSTDGQTPSTSNARQTSFRREPAGAVKQATGTDAPKQTSRQPEASSSSANRQVSTSVDEPAKQAIAIAPVARISDVPTAIPDTISPEEKANASRLPSRSKEPTPEGPETDLEPVDDDAEDGTDPVEDDPEEQPEERDPMFTISGNSILVIDGDSASFYPQQIGLAGSQAGGGIALAQPIQLPSPSGGFGETWYFTQTGPSVGNWDPTTGQVNLQMPMATIDIDGDTALIEQFSLTTGTVVERNDAGIVVSISGVPRTPAGGLLKLVGLGRIPLGFKHNYEGTLVRIEIWANLDFGTSLVSQNGLP